MGLAWWVFPIFGVTLCSLLLFLGVLSPQFTGWIWQSAPGEGSPARLLLEGYRRWYLVLLAVFGGGGLLNACLTLVQLAGAAGCLRVCALTGKGLRENYLRRLLDWELDPEGEEPEFTPEELAWCREAVARREAHSAAGGLLAVGTVLSFLVTAMFAAVLLIEKVPALSVQAKADLEQLEAGTWENAVVWISPKCRSARLPGPWTSGQPELVTRYGIISEETGGEWQRIRVPNSAGFALDQGKLYEEGQTVCWNWENAQLYYVGYTTNFHLAAEITPVPPAAMEGVAGSVLPPEELEHLNLS